jgi:glycosyltransferase involved in cell wall biosynthesis
MNALKLPPDAKLSIVMITLNEEAATRKVVTDLREIVGDAEIVIVDSSTDRTPDIAEELGCKVIRQLPPQGYGIAMDTALKAATGDIIITLDCDDTYPVSTIPRLLDKMSEGYDVVSASRLEKRPDAMPFSNYLANCLFSAMAYFLCGVSTTDVHTGMRAYKTSVLRALPYDAAPALPVELYIGSARLGYKCTEIFLNYRIRIGDSKLLKLIGTYWTFTRIWKWHRFKDAHSVVQGPSSTNRIG